MSEGCLILSLYNRHVPPCIIMMYCCLLQSSSLPREPFFFLSWMSVCFELFAMMINGKHLKLFRKNKFSWVNNMFCSFLLLSVSDKKIISKSYWVATIVEYTGWKNFNAQSVYYTIISDVSGSIPGSDTSRWFCCLFLLGPS